MYDIISKQLDEAITQVHAFKDWLETEKSGDIGPNTAMLPSEALMVISLFLKLANLEDTIIKNRTDPGIFPIWAKLIAAYKAVPMSILKNFGGENIVSIHEKLYSHAMSQLITN